MTLKLQNPFEVLFCDLHPKENCYHLLLLSNTWLAILRHHLDYRFYLQKLRAFLVQCKTQNLVYYRNTQFFHNLKHTRSDMKTKVLKLQSLISMVFQKCPINNFTHDKSLFVDNRDSSHDINFYAYSPQSSQISTLFDRS